ncbi:hypothetical protein [Methanothermobacter sp. DP]|uniref:hypothetical protein n=1 Tax=Methanothermobacter sp. DP TaxID=2998972 RepID=UPI002AA53400|nr:hypothetical protein [Methanothermobacter sp. DP]
MRDIMSENYTTGIAGLDDILGELEPGSVMLVTGPPRQVNPYLQRSSSTGDSRQEPRAFS